ncbi:MAG: hypothetical protein H6668_01355 [Ardenticatenaceae bacterium]|nr:hypothetical protein [Ardenticatenaceae bacterium]
MSYSLFSRAILGRNDGRNFTAIGLTPQTAVNFPPTTPSTSHSHQYRPSKFARPLQVATIPVR